MRQIKEELQLLLLSSCWSRREDKKRVVESTEISYYRRCDTPPPLFSIFCALGVSRVFAIEVSRSRGRWPGSLGLFPLHLYLTILAIMTFLFQRVALGAVCTAMHLASTQAFLPSTSLSTSAWKHGSGSPQTVRNGVRGDARSLSTRTAMTLMEGDRNAEHDLFIVGVGYLG